ncbi:hypothetical protein GCM10011611_66220 [Aliidongia dinghuensis]|uniref:Uncharacterized protein n=2 Tax=Aliidongia dinghuensis TaxID=1867774 RepID=A0A8J2Z280_9PROT|nr:hypothetical protein GCM10011611_66220 [Aliidongia dinghuensis]
MLYEIFKNTEDHALHDAAGDLLEISIRAVKTKHHAMSPEGLARIVEGFRPLADYCRSLVPPEGNAQTHFFELSILDSGPGFAVTWLSKPLEHITLDQEEDAVRACFGRGSSKTDSHFGEGLPHVIRLLRRQRGFLRLRTGRLSLYADFSTPTETENEVWLQRYDPPDQHALAPVSGSLLTVLLPMRR